VFGIVPGAIGLGLSLIGPGTGAALPVRVNVAGKGSCPLASDVARELAQLLPHVAVAALADPEGRDDAVVRENGNELTVSIAGQERRFSQPACSERAQLAAVFIAVVLDPPHFPEPEADTAAPRAAPAARKAAPLDFELGPLVQWAPVADGATVPPAIGLGARGGWGRPFGVTLGVAAISSSPIRYAKADVQALWIPLDAGARLAWSSGRWGLDTELSVTLEPVRFRGFGVSYPASTWRVDGGGRAAVVGRFWAARQVGLFLSLYGFVFPAPFTFGVAGLGEVGQAPVFWAGAQLGLVVGTP
jgi:hypothetical protein